MSENLINFMNLAFQAAAHWLKWCGAVGSGRNYWLLSARGLIVECQRIDTCVAGDCGLDGGKIQIFKAVLDGAGAGLIERQDRFVGIIAVAQEFIGQTHDPFAAFVADCNAVMLLEIAFDLEQDVIGLL